MTHSFQNSEGIILRALPFRDYDHILTLFTPDRGVLKLIFHGSRSKRKGSQGLCTPLTHVEVIYREKGGEIFVCEEMKLIDSFSALRNDLRYLDAACDLLHAVASSQFPDKPAPHLYSLLAVYLKKIPLAVHPSALAISFRLKLLKHDGLFHFPFICSDCGENLLSKAFIAHEDVWCSKHRPLNSQVWNLAELEQLYRLAACQNFQDIRFEQVSELLYLQIAKLFEARVRG